MKIVHFKISNKIIHRYGELCPYSTHKCDSFSEIEFKIQRAANLGQVVDIRRPIHEIKYGNLTILIDMRNQEIFHIDRCDEDQNWIPEEIKDYFEKEYYNITL